MLQHFVHFATQDTELLVCILLNTIEFTVIRKGTVNVDSNAVTRLHSDPVTHTKVIGEKLSDKKFSDKPIGYMKDAWIRFRKNKASDKYIVKRRK